MKKKYCIIIIFISSFLVAQGQYKSIFGISQTSWNIRHIQLGGELLDSLAIIGDTIFNNVNWKKGMYHGYLLEGYPCYLREDTTTGKIWYANNTDSSSKLILSLSLMLNDSFYIFSAQKYYFVDSVYFKNGLKHIRLDTLIETNEKLTFIEGIGSNIGLSYSDTVISYAFKPYLLCMHKDGVLYYQNTHPIHNGNCDVSNTGISREFDEYQISIYPNPAQDLLHIETTLPNSTLVMYDITGKEMLQASITEQTQQLDISILPKGLYLCRIFQDNNNISSIKIIKEH